MAEPNLELLISKTLWPCLKAERQRLEFIDRWYRYDHDLPHRPRVASIEYKQLSARAQTPWLSLVVTSVAQALYVEGYRSASDSDNARPWDYWQANRMDSRQIAIHRAALAYGISYTTVVPGKDKLTDASMPVISGVDPSNMVTFYDDLQADPFPQYALQTDPIRRNGKAGYRLSYWDYEAIFTWTCDAQGTGLEYEGFQEHDMGVCPITRYTNTLDLRGRSDGEVEPFIPLAGRIDQTVFDRLVVQRFASWKVRTIAGMVPPDKSTDDQREAAKMKLAVEDILVAASPDTRFGTLDATELDGFINAKDADIRDLAAVSQTPPHYLLGSVVNLSAEALAAADATLTRKIDERQHTFGESHEQTLRLCAWADDDRDAAADFSAQVRWKDTESRSMAQSADALGKLATMLGVPVEMLWSKIPGWTQQDVDEAKRLADAGGGVENMLKQLVGGGVSPAQPPPTGS